METNEQTNQPAVQSVQPDVQHQIVQPTQPAFLTSTQNTQVKQDGRKKPRTEKQQATWERAREARIKRYEERRRQVIMEEEKARKEQNAPPPAAVAPVPTVKPSPPASADNHNHNQSAVASSSKPKDYDKLLKAFKNYHKVTKEKAASQKERELEIYRKAKKYYSTKYASQSHTKFDEGETGSHSSRSSNERDNKQKEKAEPKEPPKPKPTESRFAAFF